MGPFFNPLNPGKCRQTSVFNSSRLEDVHDLHCEIVSVMAVQLSLNFRAVQACDHTKPSVSETHGKDVSENKEPVYSGHDGPRERRESGNFNITSAI